MLLIVDAEAKVGLSDTCQPGDVCADAMAQCRSGRCQCQTDHFEMNNGCRTCEVLFNFNQRALLILDYKLQ